jgi:mRNA interferase RelE/StbE
MSHYSLDIDKKASKDILSLDKSTRNFILDELESFINNFDEEYEKELIKLTKIKALKGEFKGLYRLRLRTYRVIYEKINNKLVILVLRVSHRKDVYK